MGNRPRGDSNQAKVRIQRKSKQLISKIDVFVATLLNLVTNTSLTWQGWERDRIRMEYRSRGYIAIELQ